MNRHEANLAAAQYVAQNAALKAQVRWMRKMLRRAYGLISSDLDDEEMVEPWLNEYRREMNRGAGRKGACQ